MRQLFDDREQFGPITFIRGRDGGRYPFCNSLLIEDEVKAIVDPGCSQRGLRDLSRQGRIHQVILSHYHEDHVQCANYFEGTHILAHELDLPGVRTIDGLMDMYGVEGTMDKNIWHNYLVNGLHLTDLPQAKQLPGDELDFGTVKAQVIHLPGHTPGHFGLYFAEQGILFSADMDLHWFGPYYGDSVSSLAQTLSSIEVIRQIKPKVLLTGHSAGAVTSLIQERIMIYREKIFIREKLILQALNKPMSTRGLVREHLIYGRQYQPRILFNLIEGKMIREHLTHLVADGKVEQVGNDLFIRK